jgi:hypothetical protein
MRPVPFVLALCTIALGSVRSAADTVVYVDTRGDRLLPADSAYLETVIGKERKVPIFISRKGDGRRIRVLVNYTGDLGASDLEQLLQPVLADVVAEVSKKYHVYVSAKGDKHRVSVEISSACGMLCGSSVSYLYTYDGDWRFLYSYNHAIS